MINERKLSENELDSRFAAVKGLLKNKTALVKKYGKDAEKVMYGIATKQAKKKVENMNLEKVKEMVEASISNPKAADLNKDGKLSDYETKRATAIEKNLKEDRFVDSSMEDLEQVIRNLAHTANISEDEALEMAIRKLEAKLDRRDDLDDYDMNEAIRQDLGMSSSVSKSRAKAALKNPSNDGSKVYGLDKDGKRVELKSINDIDKFKKFEIDADLKETVTESKGAKNYFDDVKYVYQKAFRYLEANEKEEYKQLAKNYFSSLKESINEETFEDEIERLKTTMYVDDDNPRQILVHPLSKPDARRPDNCYIVIKGNNVTAIQGYDSGPISDLAKNYNLDDSRSSLTPVGKISASGQASLLSSNILKDAIKAIKDSRDIEAKNQKDYYSQKSDTGRIGYGLSSQPRVKEDQKVYKVNKKELAEKIKAKYSSK